MTVLNDILKPTEEPVSPVKMITSGDAPTPRVAKTDLPSDKPAGGGNVALFEKLNPYTPPTAEQLEKERKKQKRNELFAAIGDGISALSNLYFTTRGAPNMYTGKNTMSERVRVRYDKLMKEREAKNAAYYEGLMKARQADADDVHRERSWQRLIGLDQEARDRRKKEDARYEREWDYRQERNEAADAQWKATHEEAKRQNDRNYSFRAKQHKDNVDVRLAVAQASAARGVRGKLLGFSDGNGNRVSIYENVWRGSMQQVFDVMLDDGAGKPPSITDNVYKRRLSQMTAKEKDDFVKQNWHKSPKASAIMKSLSGLDPATMTSELNDDVEEYTPGGGDDEVIDYIPGNKY